MDKPDKIYSFTAAAIFAVLLIFAVVLNYRNTLRENFQEQIKITLHETSEQSAVLLETEIKKRFHLLRAISSTLNPKIVLSNPREILKHLKQSLDLYEFRRFGIIYPDGTAYTTDDKTTNLSDRVYFQKSMKGESAISDTITGRTVNEKINALSVPVYDKNKIIAVLYAVYPAKFLKDKLSLSALGGDAYSYIANRKGDIIVDSDHPSSVKNINNFFDTLMLGGKENEPVIHDMRHKIFTGKDGYIKYFNGEYKYAHYCPLTINDWYLLKIISLKNMDKSMDFVMHRTNFLIFYIFIIISLLFFGVINIQIKNKNKLTKIAYVDELTGGDSYVKFCIDAREKLNNPFNHAAIINININGFKIFNTSFGHSEGNKVISYVWKMLNAAVKPGDICTHQMADNFYALLFYDNQSDLINRLSVFYESLHNYNIDEKNNYKISVSIGIYEITDTSQNIATMTDYANLATKSIKRHFSIFYAFFDINLQNKLLKESVIENQMRDALKNNEFIVYYQPKFKTSDKKMIGAEALVRWKKSDGSIISPVNFIPLFEQNWFIIQLDKYIFEQVCRQQKIWLKQNLHPVPISVNLSRLHFYNHNFIAEYKAILEKYDLPAKYIQFEITESVLFENMELFHSVVERLHKLGFIILIDDFGIGYSSIMILRNIKIDVLKFDKSFIDTIGDERTEKIITHIISLAHSLNIEVISEGVETEKQYQFLKKIGGDTIQGYYFAKPVTAENFRRFLTLR